MSQGYGVSDAGNGEPRTVAANGRCPVRFSAELRHDTAIAMKRLSDFGSTPQLLEILRDKDQEAIHWICIDALGEIHAPAAEVRAS